MKETWRQVTAGLSDAERQVMYEGLKKIGLRGQGCGFDDREQDEVAPGHFGLSARRSEKKGSSMLTVRKSNERGHADHGWLDSHHTFSFANYYDPEHMGYRSLRVINEDRVAEGRGFGAHSHRDMEILSYVLKGKLAHKDSMGHVEELGPNEIHRCRPEAAWCIASSMDRSTEPVHFLQIWIEPKSRGHVAGL